MRPLVLGFASRRRYSFCHADGAGGTYEAAKVTAHALRAYDAWQAPFVVESNGLMTSILTSNVASPTPHALLSVDFRIDNCLSVEL